MNIKVKLAKNSPNKNQTLTSSHQLNSIVYKLRQSNQNNDKQNIDSNQIIQFNKRKNKNQLFRSYQFIKNDNPLECREDFITDRNYNRYQDDRNSFINQRCQSQQNLCNLANSQQHQITKKNNNNRKIKYENVGTQQLYQSSSSLTFNSIKMKNGLAINNNEFIQQKKIKRQVIDQIIRNGCKKNVNSVKNMVSNFMECANEDGKKAKYRIISIQEQGEQLYYCSKCSIMLLQQGFKVQQIDGKKQMRKEKTVMNKRRVQCENILNRIRQIQGSLKGEINKLQDLSYLGSVDEQLQNVKQIYDTIISVMEQIKKKQIQKLQQAKSKVLKQVENQKAQLFKKFTYLQNIRDQLQDIHNKTKIQEQQFQTILSQYKQQIQYHQQYQPLQFTIKQSNIQTKLQIIISQLEKYFHHHTFQKQPQHNLNTAQDYMIEDLIKKPFRNLFPEQDSNNKKVSKYYNGQFIQQRSQNCSPSFQKKYY